MRLIHTPFSRTQITMRSLVSFGSGLFLVSGITALLFHSAPSVYAHAGVMKNAGDIDVILKQSPLSPLVGENVSMTFIFTEHDGNEQIRSHDVKLKLIDTFYGDESKDRVILQKHYTTDVNGVISFEYAFPKENYFDVELVFLDQSGTVQQIGFLVQPRVKRWDIRMLVRAFLTGILTAMAILRIRHYRTKLTDR